jgi:hypothetical protein
VASSADGAKLVAAAAPRRDGHGNPLGGGPIYTSTNSGATWTRTSAPTDGWRAVASSFDGARLVAAHDAAYFDSIFTSNDSGATWTETSAPTNFWTAVACSADGANLIAAAGVDPSANLGSIYISSDSGATWTQTNSPKEYWWCVASSADGRKLVAGAGGSNARLWGSTNSGVTWAELGTPAATWWYGIASSADGNKVVAVSGDGYIITLQSPAPGPPAPPAPRLSVDRSGAHLGLSWLVPSTRFVLQQCSDLRPAQWADVPMSPTLDFNNLNHRVTLTVSRGSTFYRLRQQ